MGKFMGSLIDKKKGEYGCSIIYFYFYSYFIFHFFLGCLLVGLLLYLL